MAVLILLDLSAAFDTLKHTVLLNRLQSRFGVRDDALTWIASYLSDREQYVVIGPHTSKPRPLATGVPKGLFSGQYSSRYTWLHWRTSSQNMGSIPTSTLMTRNCTLSSNPPMALTRFVQRSNNVYRI